MWRVFSHKTQVTILVTLTLLAWWSLSFIIDIVSTGASHPLKWSSTIATFLIVVVGGVAAKLWRPAWRRFPILGKFVFPDLAGTWRGTITSTWKSESGEQTEPIQITFWIRQSIFSISIKTATSESPSYSTRYFLEADKDADRYRIWYSYDNQPMAHVARRSPRHEGVAWLEMDLELNSNRLAGQYFTDRQTTGNIELTRISDNVEAVDR